MLTGKYSGGVIPAGSRYEGGAGRAQVEKRLAAAAVAVAAAAAAAAAVMAAVAVAAVV